MPPRREAGPVHDVEGAVLAADSQQAPVAAEAHALDVPQALELLHALAFTSQALVNP